MAEPQRILRTPTIARINSSRDRSSRDGRPSLGVICMRRGFDMPQTLFATASATPGLREANFLAASTMGFPKTLFATASAKPGWREADLPTASTMGFPRASAESRL
jgi:hypothetical protein